MKDIEIYNRQKKVLKLLVMVILFLVIISMFTGCTTKKPNVVYEIKTVEVKVPVREPLVVPRITCNFSGKGIVPTEKLIKCISKQKAFIDKLEKSNIIKYVDNSTTVSNFKK